MQAIILCGGRGERLMPMTACTPAALLRILGKTTAAYTLDQFKKAGFKEVTLALGYLGEQIIEEFESCDYKGMKLYFTSAEELGTAPAVAYAAKAGEDIIVAEANCVFDFDLNGIADYHRAKKIRSYLCNKTGAADKRTYLLCYRRREYDNLYVEISQR